MMCLIEIGIHETLEIKKLPDYGQGATQMFSQRNNPYCELLSSCKDNLLFVN